MFVHSQHFWLYLDHFCMSQQFKTGKNRDSHLLFLLYHTVTETLVFKYYQMHVTPFFVE